MRLLIAFVLCLSFSLSMAYTKENREIQKPDLEYFFRKWSGNHCYNCGHGSPGFHSHNGCVNLYDENCANNNHNGAAEDDWWLNNGKNPGRR